MPHLLWMFTFYRGMYSIYQNSGLVKLGILVGCAWTGASQLASFLSSWRPLCVSQCNCHSYSALAGAGTFAAHGTLVLDWTQQSSVWGVVLYYSRLHSPSRPICRRREPFICFWGKLRRCKVRRLKAIIWTAMVLMLGTCTCLQLHRLLHHPKVRDMQEIHGQIV